MVANATVCIGCCYIAIFRFPASPSRNIRHLRYDGTMPPEGRLFAAVRKRYEKGWASAFCVMRTSKLACLVTLDATLSGGLRESWTRRSLGCENHRRILFHV